MGSGTATDLIHGAYLGTPGGTWELPFSKLKTLLRKANTRTFEQVEKAIAELLGPIAPEECIPCSRENPKKGTAQTPVFSDFHRFDFPDFRVSGVYQLFPGSQGTRQPETTML